MALGNIDPSTYSTQLDEKVATTISLFAGLSLPEPEIFQSPSTHYRFRAEFRVWHDQEDLYHIMFNPVDKSRIRIDEWLPGSQLIGEVMKELLEHIKPNETLRRKLFQIDYLSSKSGEILVSLLYHRQLDAAWLEAIKALKATLSTKFNIDFVGRARKQKFIIERDYVDEVLTVDEKTFRYQQIENSFTQPNAFINEIMLSWARGLGHDKKTDLLELYCGNGNFTLALADQFRQVLATEIAKSSIRSAQKNQHDNNIKNVSFLKTSSEDFSAALNSKTQSTFKEIDINNFDFSTILVDPPRAGLDEATIELTQKFDNIIYVSCNPETLKSNLEVLTQTHDVVKFALFDQFPYTHHIESGVFLMKR